MDKILGFLTPKISLWAIGIFAVLLAVQSARLWDRGQDLKTEKELHDVCKLARQTLQDNQDRLEAAIDDQNAKIKALEAEKRRRATLAAAEAKKALEATEKAKAEASRLGSGPAVMNAWQKGLYQ